MNNSTNTFQKDFIACDNKLTYSNECNAIELSFLT
jgi:hypothetical protein